MSRIHNLSDHVNVGSKSQSHAYTATATGQTFDCLGYGNASIVTITTAGTGASALFYVLASNDDASYTNLGLIGTSAMGVSGEVIISDVSLKNQQYRYLKVHTVISGTVTASHLILRTNPIQRPVSQDKTVVKF